MNSLLQVLAVCLLLKTCTANFNQASQDPNCQSSTNAGGLLGGLLETLKNGLSTKACNLPLLEVLSFLVGDYSNAEQVTRYQEHFDQPFVDAVKTEYKPLDIPALNQYYPLLFLQEHNGVASRTLLKLTAVDEIGQYIMQSYTLTNPDKFLSGELDFADISLADLSGIPVCTALLARRKDIVMDLLECMLDFEGNTAAYSLNFMCDSLDVLPGKGAPELYKGIPYMFNKTESYSLPDSWLTGYDYVNPCGSH